MDFPGIEPTARTFDPGNFPVKTYRSQSGQETRILYGSTRVDLKLSLTYANLPDAVAAQFLDHFDAMKGTFKRFHVVGETLAGFLGGHDRLQNRAAGVKFRYEGPPQLSQVRFSRSTVTVNLIGVL